MCICNLFFPSYISSELCYATGDDGFKKNWLKWFACFSVSFPQTGMYRDALRLSQMCRGVDPVSCYFTTHLPCGGWASEARVSSASGPSASWPGVPWWVSVPLNCFSWCEGHCTWIPKQLRKGFLSFLTTCTETLSECVLPFHSTLGCLSAG